MSKKNKIKELIIKNKKSLICEIQKNRELAALLGKSTYKKLSPEEKVRTRELLINICRTIPAFAIFMLPGGSVLLPLLAQLIPEILPESFRKKKEPKNNN